VAMSFDTPYVLSLCISISFISFIAHIYFSGCKWLIFLAASTNLELAADRNVPLRMAVPDGIATPLDGGVHQCYLPTYIQVGISVRLPTTASSPLSQ
jgi:hypothetical protein